MSLGSVIKSLRIKQNISQQQLAATLNIRNNYLSRIEKGHDLPSIQLADKIAQALNIPTPILFFLTLEPEDLPTQKAKSTYQQTKTLIDNLVNQLF